LQGPTTPATQPPPGITRHRFRLVRVRSPLLTESLLFSLPPGTEMFHFPGFPPPALYIQAGVTPHHGCRVPPFGHPRINARLTAPRGLSRPPTSFIGSWYQGIHHAPLTTYTKPAQQRAHHTQRSEHTKKLNTLQTTTTPHSAKEEREPMVAMLASTIQFTNTHPQPTTPDPTPPPTPPTQAPASHTRHRAKRRGKSGCYGACGRPGLQRQHTPRRRQHEPATTVAGAGRTRQGLFPQDPTVRRHPPLSHPGPADTAAEQQA
jgi:hypothetical protein